MKTFTQYITEEEKPSYDLNGKVRKIGKKMGHDLYVHKDHAEAAGIPHHTIAAAAKHLPKDHKYHIIKHNAKEGSTSFIHSPDFDTSHEPIAGTAIKVHKDGHTTTTKQKKDPQIYHHKWQMVSDHHKGFDTNKSKERSKHWRGIVGTDRAVSSRIGTKSYWDREVVPKLHEEHEPATLGRKIKAATTGDNESYKILDSHPHTKGTTWQAGGCGVLAHALHKHLPGSKLVDVHNKKTGHTEHVAVHHGDHIYDANGATPAKHFLKKFAKNEMKSHQDLELTPHDSARAKKSDISTHPGLIDKTHKHLKSQIG